MLETVQNPFGRYVFALLLEVDLPIGTKNPDPVINTSETCPTSTNHMGCVDQY